jgi:hypothetical protein
MDDLYAHANSHPEAKADTKTSKPAGKPVGKPVGRRAGQQPEGKARAKAGAAHPSTPTSAGAPTARGRAADRVGQLVEDLSRTVVSAGQRARD